MLCCAQVPMSAFIGCKYTYKIYIKCISLLILSYKLFSFQVFRLLSLVGKGQMSVATGRTPADTPALPASPIYCLLTFALVTQSSFLTLRFHPLNWCEHGLVPLKTPRFSDCRGEPEPCVSESTIGAGLFLTAAHPPFPATHIAICAAVSA